MGASSQVVESGIAPKRDDAEQLLQKARELGYFVEAHLKNFFLDLIQLEGFALEKLRDYTPTDRLLTLKEAAAYLHYEPRTVYSWCKREKPLIQHTYLGGELRFRKAWLDSAIDNGSVKPRGVVKL